MWQRSRRSFGTPWKPGVARTNKATAFLRILLRKSTLLSGTQNPFLGFRVRGVQPGDELIVRYVDNKGETGQGTAIIK
jgi:hypothetical protein